MDKQWLMEHDFKQCSWMDKEGLYPYYYRFNVYRDDYDARLDCEITIYQDGAFDIDVFDGAYSRAKYAPWYNGDDTGIVRQIKKKIDKVVSKLGLYEN